MAVRKRILGLTGGMGCGKSSALAAFAAEGWEIFDADKFIRNLLQADQSIIERILGHFGPNLRGEDGGIDRRALAARVFNDEIELHWLENLLHPRLYAAWREVLAGPAGARWVFEVPLLFEQELENWFDFIVCVSASSATQLARLEQRGISRLQAEERIRKQMPLARKIEKAEYVIVNDGSRQHLVDQVRCLSSRLS